MADISAAMVMELRKMSGQGMMDCKKALQETEGDVEQAMDLLRKKGLATLAKRAGRATSEGLVVNKSGDGGKTAVLVTLCCETDFVAKSDAFVATAQTLADFALACTADEGAENVLATAIDGRKFSSRLSPCRAVVKERPSSGEPRRIRSMSSRPLLPVQPA